jgi:hypothetical protein
MFALVVLNVVVWRVFSRCLHNADTADEKVRFASARGSAILATLTEGISKLSGPRWIQKVDNLKSSRRNVSEIKLKRTDTTLDLCSIVSGCIFRGGSWGLLTSQKAN